MSENTKNNSPENILTQAVSESELETVAGGAEALGDRHCYFLPEKPTQQKIENNEIWVKCRSTCPGCHCRGRLRCVDRWHIMEKWMDSIYVPSPRDSYNHDRPDKAALL